jgi:thiamine pyrophosphate-dependent acetolactate synthase large subunit-like protein
MTSVTRDAAARLATTDSTTGALERPAAAGVNAPAFGSDVAAEALRDLNIPYIALNPGASFRGLHDSIVNYLGNTTPQMLLCLHEEAAVAIAHGYAKATDKPMAAAVHSNVGLMHASMAMFNAWCDRLPVIVLGATGPVDAAKRRPWIDWIHTARDQGALVRNYTKWDDQPASPAATREAILRAGWIANNVPKGPVYVNLDADVQEMKLAEPLPPMDASRLMPQVATGASAELLRKTADMLMAAKHPLILVGRVTRDRDEWNRRVALAEAVGARVATSMHCGAGFPTEHPLHVEPPTTFNGPGLNKALQEADVILSLDWVDLGGTLKALKGPPAAKIIQVSMDHHVHNGWSMDYMALPYADFLIAADNDAVVRGLLDAIGAKAKPAKPQLVATPAAKAAATDSGPLAMRHLATELRKAVGTRKTALTHLPISWNGEWWPFREPLDYLGNDGGGGLGGGPGTSVGSALALKGTGRMPIAICGDGDYLMGVTAIWTAAHYRIPILFVIANNRSFYNDEVHQERVARMRNRPVENKWIGQRISDPDPDLAGLGRAQGARGFGPVKNAADLPRVYAEAIAAVEAGETVVVDVQIEPGYAPHMATAMLAAKSDRAG